MTPEVIVHHPIPQDLETVLRSLGYSAIGAAEAHTRFVWKLETGHRQRQRQRVGSPRNPLEVRHERP